MLEAVNKTLKEFGELSGLQVQPTKSHAIVLNSECKDSHVASYPVVPLGSTVRYLGVEVGLGDTTEQNWTQRIRKLEQSLGKASSLATHLRDRVVILNTVGLPALLFTAKYASPSPTILHRLDQLWRTYFWRGTITTNPVRAHTIANPVLALSSTELGLGLRDIRTAMIEQAIKTLLQWNSKPQNKYWAALHILILRATNTAPSMLHSFPSKRASETDAEWTGSTHLLRAGWQQVNARVARRYPVPAALQQLKETALTKATLPGSFLWLSSREGQYSFPRAHYEEWTRINTMVYASQPHEIRSFWRTFPWPDNTWITDARGRTLKTRDFPGIAIQTLGELDLQPLDEG